MFSGPPQNLLVSYLNQPFPGDFGRSPILRHTHMCQGRSTPYIYWGWSSHFQWRAMFDFWTLLEKLCYASGFTTSVWHVRNGCNFPLNPGWLTGIQLVTILIQTGSYNPQLVGAQPSPCCQLGKMVIRKAHASSSRSAQPGYTSNSNQKIIETSNFPI